MIAAIICNRGLDSEKLSDIPCNFITIYDRDVEPGETAPEELCSLPHVL